MATRFYCGQNHFTEFAIPKAQNSWNSMFGRSYLLTSMDGPWAVGFNPLTILCVETWRILFLHSNILCMSCIKLLVLLCVININKISSRGWISLLSKDTQIKINYTHLLRTTPASDWQKTKTIDISLNTSTSRLCQGFICIILLAFFYCF